VLLALLAVVFLLGFREAIGMAIVVAVPYLLLSLVVLVRGLVEIAARPALWSGWHRALEARGDWSTIAAGALLVFPKLALGMSGFETGVSVMPLIDGGASDAQPRRGAAPPVGQSRLVVATGRLSASITLSKAPVRGGLHDMARAIPKAAPAASPPMSTVWSALRRGAVPVKWPLM